MSDDNDENNNSDSSLTSPNSTFSSSDERHLTRVTNRFSSRFLHLAYCLGKASDRPFVLDLVINIVVYLRLILWPFYVVQDSDYWEPSSFANVIKEVVELISSPVEIYGNGHGLLYLYILMLVFTFLIAIVFLASACMPVLRKCNMVMTTLYLALGLITYAMLDFGLELSASIFWCENYSTVQCSSVIHGILFGLSIFAGILLILMSFFYVVIGVDNKIFSNNPFHRVPENDIIQLWAMQVALFCLSIYRKFRNDISDNVNLYIVFVLYAMYAYNMSSNRRYYNYTVSLIIRTIAWCMLCSVTVVMLLLMYPADSRPAVVYLWILAELLVVGFFCTRASEYLDVGGVSSRLEFSLLRFFVYQQLPVKTYVRGASMQLQGFIFRHLKICDDPMCPFVDSLVNANSITKEFKGRLDEAAAISNKERLQKMMLIKYISYKFAKDVRASPTDSAMRLERTQFLLEVLQNCRRAKMELAQVRPRGILQILWRFTLLNNISEFDFATSNLFSVASVAADTKEDSVRCNALQRKKDAALVQVRKAEERLIEAECHSAEACYKLWSYASLVRPKLAIMQTLIVNAAEAHEAVARLWKEIEELSMIPAILRKLYAIYVRDVVGDHVQFDWHSQLATEIEQKVEQDNDSLEQVVFHIDMQSCPIIVASAEPFEAWKILRLNMSACQLFGYEMIQLVDQPVEMLMPKLYRVRHQQVMQLSGESDFSSTNVFAFGMHNNGFIFPVNIRVIKCVPIGEDAMLVAAFTTTRSLNKAYVITDPGYTITNVSSNAVSLLGIPRDVVHSGKVDIRTLCPALTGAPITNFSQSPVHVRFYPPPGVENMDPAAAMQINEKSALEFGLSAGTIKLHSNTCLGYYFCFVKEGSVGRSSVESLSQLRPMPKFPQFNFSIHPEVGLFVRNWNNVDRMRGTVTGTSHRLSKPQSSFIVREESKTYSEEDSTYMQVLETYSEQSYFAGFLAAKLMNIFSKLTQRERQVFERQFNHLFSERKNDELTIVTYRIENNTRHRVKECASIMRYEQEIGSEMAKIERKKTLNTNSEEYNVRQWMVNREVLLEKLNQGYHIHVLFKVFFCILLLLNSSFIVLAATKGYNDIRFGTDLDTYGEYAQDAFYRCQDYLDFLNYINLMYMVNAGIITDSGRRPKSGLLAHCNSAMKTLLSDLYIKFNLLHKVREENLLTNTKNDINSDGYTFYYSTGEIGTYNLLTAAHIYFSYMQKLLNIPVASVLATEENVITLITNCVPIIVGLIQSSRDFINEFDGLINRYSSNIDLFIIIPCVTAALSIACIVFVMLLVRSTRVKKMNVFLSLPPKKLEKIGKTIEEFLAIMKHHQTKAILDADYTSQQEKKLRTKNVFKQKLVGKKELKHKSYELSFMDTLGRIARYGFFYLIFAAYFVGLYISQKMWLQRVYGFRNEYNATGQAATYYSLGQAVLVIGYYNGSAYYYGALVSAFYPEISTKVNEISVNYLRYGDKISSSFNEVYSSLTEGNICNYVSNYSAIFITQDECNTLMSGIDQQGLFAVMTLYKTFMTRNIVRFWTLIVLNAAGTITAAQYEALRYAELNSDDMYYYSFILPEIMSPALRYLQQHMRQALSDYVRGIINIQVIAMALFLVVVVAYQTVTCVVSYREHVLSRKITMAITLIPPGLAVNNRVVIDYVKEIAGKDGDA